jgi:hypothetical protein
MAVFWVVASTRLHGTTTQKTAILNLDSWSPGSVLMSDFYMKQKHYHYAMIFDFRDSEEVC